MGNEKVEFVQRPKTTEVFRKPGSPEEATVVAFALM
jgi:hypothetical protein